MMQARTLAVAGATLLALLSAAVQAAPDDGPSRPQPGQRHAPGGPGGPGAPGGPSGGPAGGRPAEPGRWFDGAHGHAHSYPTPGWRVRVPPVGASVVFWAGISYSFFDGVWYAPGPGGFVVVRPPLGIVVADLPAFRTVVIIGGLAYYYANGVYYRERTEGGYEVVPTPVDSSSGTASTASGSNKVFVYPRQGQSAEKQASDEYECHRWAVSQAGFDPTAAATGQAAGSAAQRADYGRARGACLEGRGYTVR